MWSISRAVVVCHKKFISNHGRQIGHKKNDKEHIISFVSMNFCQIKFVRLSLSNRVDQIDVNEDYGLKIFVK